MGLALVAVLSLHLLSALLAGLLLYQLVQATVPLTKRLGVMPRLGKVMVLILVPSVMIAGITIGVLILATHLHSGNDSAPALLQNWPMWWPWRAAIFPYRCRMNCPIRLKNGNHPWPVGFATTRGS